MGLKLNTASSGSVSLEPANTASNYTLTVPAQTGTVVATDSSGNVGIGTSSPQNKLDVVKDGGNSTLRVHAKTDTSPVAKIELMRGASDTFGDTVFTSFSVRADSGIFRIESANNTAGAIDLFQIASGGNIASVIAGGTTLLPHYGARAWVNFNGTGTVAIRGSGNVSSVTDNGTGEYTVNFSTAMPDANYAGVLGGNLSSGNDGTGRISEGFYTTGTYTASSCRIRCLWQGDGSTAEDKQIINLAVFR